MNDYYDPQPTIELDRHVVLAGYVSTETRIIGQRLAALTGLRSSDLDQLIEHHVGKSIWQLIWSEREERYRQLEREHMRRALRDRPFGILTIGDAALADPFNRRLLLAETHLVALNLDLANCYWRLKSLRSAELDGWHPLFPGPLLHIDQVKPFFLAREPAMREARLNVDQVGKSLGAVVEDLHVILESLAPPAPQKA